MAKLEKFAKSKKSTYIIAGVFFVVLILGIYFLFVFKAGPKQIKPKEFTYGEVKQLADIEIAKRPYVTLTPTSDGAEIIISIENMDFFEKIEYEMTYQADNPTAPDTKIQRGATGTGINTKEQKYKTSVLLGTASRGVRSPDTGIVDGKLALHLFKGEDEYVSESNWDLAKLGLKAGALDSRDGNFKLQIPGLGKDYWVILADTIGVPKGGEFELKKVQLPVYGVFSIAGDFSAPGPMSIKGSGDLYLQNHQDSSWQKLNSSQQGDVVESKVTTFGTFVLVSSK